MVVATLEHSFTPAEQKLVELGEHTRLRGIDPETDVATEVFYLEPRRDFARP